MLQKLSHFFTNYPIFKNESGTLSELCGSLFFQFDHLKHPLSHLSHFFTPQIGLSYVLSGNLHEALILQKVGQVGQLTCKPSYVQYFSNLIPKAPTRLSHFAKKVGHFLGQVGHFLHGEVFATSLS
jgi:hypothetical protein